MSELSLPGRLGGGAYTWRAPRWLPIGVVALAVLWGGGVWWLVANVGDGDGSRAPQTAMEQGTADEVAVLRAKVDSLAQHASALAADRDALARRVAALEQRPTGPATTAAAATTAQAVEVAAPAAVLPTINAATAEYSIPRFAYRAQAAPSAAPVPTSAAPTTPAAASTAPTVSRFFTNGADTYNCTSFASQAESQEALAVNAPGDPNRLDMNGNGVACEDITYPVGSPRNVTPVPNR